MRHLDKSVLAVAAILIASSANAVQFSYLDPGYTQSIYAGPVIPNQEAGAAWTVGGNLLTRAGSNIIEYSLTPNTTYQGTTSLHGVIATHSVFGSNSVGAGMTNGIDGYVYAVSNLGLQRFNPGNWSAPAQTLAGTVGGAGYGITTLADGRIAYAAGSGSTDVYIYNPTNGSNTWIYNTGGDLIDDMASSTGSEIALAGPLSSTLKVINTAGTLLSITNNFSHYPDGLTFGDGVNSQSIFSNNNNGTITEYIFGSGYSNSATAMNDIASGSGAYGDLATVGPDCAFYVSQYEHGGYHGTTPGFGTRWDNNTVTADGSIVRIAAVSTPRPDGTSSATCNFRTPVLTTVSTVVPIPSSWFLMGSGLVALLHRSRRKAIRS